MERVLPPSVVQRLPHLVTVLDPPSAHQTCVTLPSPWCPPRRPELLLLFKDDPENKLLICEILKFIYLIHQNIHFHPHLP